MRSIVTEYIENTYIQLSQFTLISSIDVVVYMKRCGYVHRKWTAQNSGTTDQKNARQFQNNMTFEIIFSYLL